MFLISEQISDEVQLITEEKNGKKEQYIEGVFLQAGIKNRNGRIYPIETMKKEVNRYIKEFVNKKRAYGELGHPEGPTINLERVSHLITDLKEDGKNFIGKAKILSTPMGNIVKGLLNDGAKLGVSSRGMGSVEQRGNAQYVQDDFMLATAADIVADPSAPDAFVNGVMEGKEWVWENGILQPKVIEQYKEYVLSVKDKNQIEEAKLIVFKHFLSNF